jgi:hypothetical protein
MEKILPPWFVTGLVDGEGCFSISFTLCKKLKIGIKTRSFFSVSLSRRDLFLIKKVHTFFECGAVRYSKSDRIYKYEVRSIKDLITKVLPHFKSYPLQGSKSKDFDIFQEICKDIYTNHHLSRKFLRRIISEAYEMNPSGNRKHEKNDLLRMLGEIMV